MSSDSSSSMMLMTFIIIISSSLQQLPLVSAFEFEVGDRKGWVVPPSNDTKFFNDWASEKRFKLSDSLRFRYRKDSVMEVNEAEYMKCNSTRPLFFSNTGNTVVVLDRSGIYYFISGAAGHCDKGQRMIVKVLGHDLNPDDPGHHPSSSSSPAKSATHVFMMTVLLLLFLSYSHL